MSRNDTDWVVWTREHRLACELAAAPMDEAASAERHEAGRW